MGPKSIRALRDALTQDFRGRGGMMLVRVLISRQAGRGRNAFVGRRVRGIRQA